MENSIRQRSVVLRLVASDGRVDDEPMWAPGATAASAEPSIRLVVDGRSREQLHNTMTLVSSARRAAARRLRHKQLVGKVTSIGLIAGFAAVAAAQGAWAAAVDAAMHHKLSVIGLVLAISALLSVCRRSGEQLVVDERDLTACAAAIDVLRTELMRGDIADTDLVHDVRLRYNNVLRRCAAKHSRMDYLVARPGIGGAPRQHWRRQLGFMIDVYAVNAALVLLPAIAALIG